MSKWRFSNVWLLKILNERLDALERDNIEDEEAFNESDLYDEDEDVAAQLFINHIGSCGSTKKTERNISSEISVILYCWKSISSLAS